MASSKVSAQRRRALLANNCRRLRDQEVGASRSGVGSAKHQAKNVPQAAVHEGMLVCFYCENGDHNGTDPSDGPGILKAIASRCFELARTSPLELLCLALLEHADADLARRVVGAYEEFLATLNDEEKRNELKELDSSTAVTNELFLQMRDLSHKYSRGLEELFFDSDGFKSLTRKYGVF